MEAGKQKWPEVNGIDVDQAVELIKTENSALKVQKVKEGSMVTRDFNLNRVRVWYDEKTNKVKGVPKTG